MHDLHCPLTPSSPFNFYGFVFLQTSYHCSPSHFRSTPHVHHCPFDLPRNWSVLAVASFLAPPQNRPNLLSIKASQILLTEHSYTHSLDTFRHTLTHSFTFTSTHISQAILETSLFPLFSLQSIPIKPQPLHLYRIGFVQSTFIHSYQ